MWSRFGFFSGSHPAALACQHNRIAVLHAKPYSTFPGKSPKSTPLASRKPISDFALRDRAGSTASVVPLPSPTALKLELKRIAKWGDMLRVKTRAGGNVTEWDLAQGVAEGSGGGWTKLQRRVYKGVPDRWRRAVWGLELERFRDTLATVPRKAKSLDELSRDYRVSASLLTRHLKTNQSMYDSSSSPRNLIKMFRLISTCLAPLVDMYCFTLAMAKGNDRCSMCCTLLVCIVSKWAGIARAWDRLPPPFCVISSLRCVVIP